MKKYLLGAALALATISAAQAADMAVKAPPAPVAAPAPSWNGLYAGGNIGGGWGSRNVAFTPNDPSAAASLFGNAGGPPSTSLSSSGVLGGVQLGYNWQFSRNGLVGLETDFDWSGMKGSSSSGGIYAGIIPFTNTVDEHIKSFGTVRARLGYLPTDNLLAYVTGGFAYGRVEQTGSYVNNSGLGMLVFPVGGFSFTCAPVATCATGSSNILPICIRAGALGEAVPRRDLWVSPNHAMYFKAMYFKGDHLEGVLIEAKDLVNGVSIVQVERPDKVEYHHIELDRHDVIIAEGAFSESFIDDDSRAMFHNAHEYYALHPEEVSEAAQYCAPRLDEGYEVEAARRCIALRAGLLHAADLPPAGRLRGFVDKVSANRIAGWAQNIDNPEAPVCLDIVADGRVIGQTLANIHREDLKRAGLGSGRHSFVFSLPTGDVLTSETVEVRRSADQAPLDLSNTAKAAAAA